MARSLTRRDILATVGGVVGGVATAGCALPAPTVGPEEFSVAVLPDTQHYTRLDNGIFEAQTRWLVDNRDRYDIRAVLHLGDLVNNPRKETHWATARDAVGTLDEAGMPALLALGNHDGANVRQPTAFRTQFPSTRYRRLADAGVIDGFGTFDGTPENAYIRRRIGGREYLFLTLEFGPRAAVVDWGNRVLARHREADAIVTTHSYMYFDDTRVDRADDNNPRSYGLEDVHNGRELWPALVRRHPNVINVHSGHHIPHNTGTRIDSDRAGTPTAQMFVNYQREASGGQGWLRLLVVDPVGETLSVRTYSPHLGRWATTGEEWQTVPF